MGQQNSKAQPRTDQATESITGRRGDTRVLDTEQRRSQGAGCIGGSGQYCGFFGGKVGPDRPVRSMVRRQTPEDNATALSTNFWLCIKRQRMEAYRHCYCQSVSE